MNLKQALAEKKKLTKKQLDLFKGSYDIVGTIAILEIPQELVKKEKLIAETVLAQHKQVKTVVKKVGIHHGELRLQKVKILAGEKTKETTHTESKTRLKLHIEKVYFSVRLSTERLRIAQQIKPGERILVMFSGCAPYPCVFAKNSPAKEIYGIELNEEGHRYGLENIKLNKIKNVKLLQGDVRTVVPKLMKTEQPFDRVVMPLTRDASDFMDTALSSVKNQGIIHFYDFVQEGEFPKASIAKIETACKKARCSFNVLNTVKCGSYAPRRFRVCIDFEIVW